MLQQGFDTLIEARTNAVLWSKANREVVLAVCQREAHERPFCVVNFEVFLHAELREVMKPLEYYQAGEEVDAPKKGVPSPTDTPPI